MGFPGFGNSTWDVAGYGDGDPNYPMLPDRRGEPVRKESVMIDWRRVFVEYARSAAAELGPLGNLAAVQVADTMPLSADEKAAVAAALKEALAPRDTQQLVIEFGE